MSCVRNEQVLAHSRPLLSVGETIDLLRSSRTSVYRLIEKGDLKPVKIGGRTLFRRADLDALIERSVVA